MVTQLIGSVPGVLIHPQGFVLLQGVALMDQRISLG